MAFSSHREFLEALKARGELKRIDIEVDWDEEIGAIVQEAIIRKAPALLFTNIKDYKDSHGKKISMLTDANLKRVCIALEMPENSAHSELIDMWKTRTKNCIKPVLLSSGPCKEIIHDAINLTLSSWYFRI